MDKLPMPRHPEQNAPQANLSPRPQPARGHLRKKNLQSIKQSRFHVWLSRPSSRCRLFHPSVQYAEAIIFFLPDSQKSELLTERPIWFYAASDLGAKN
jgi:hypothetical protein